MSKNPLDWDESDLKGLINQSENYHLEFKDIKLITNNPTNNDPIAKSLTKEVSAFANAEGGTIIIGLAEDNSKPAKANKLEGVELSVMDSEKLQRIVESNFSPHLSGMRFKAIPLSTTPVTYAFIIIVPQGSNAYQSKERIYYGRSEYECKPLHDTMIRLLINRGRTTQGIMGLQYPQVRRAEDVYQSEMRRIDSGFRRDYRAEGGLGSSLQREMEQKIAQEQARTRREPHDEYTFGLQLQNVGELTITECYLILEFLFSPQPDNQPVAHAQKHEGQTKSGFTKDNFIFSSQESVFNNKKSSTFIPEKKIYPGISVRFPEQIGFIVKIPAGQTLEQNDARLKWTLYYDNFPSNSGEIKFTDIDEFRNL